MRSHRLKLRIAGEEEKVQPNNLLIEEHQNVVQNISDTTENKMASVEQPPQITAEAVEIKQNALKKPPLKKK